MAASESEKRILPSKSSWALPEKKKKLPKINFMSIEAENPQVSEMEKGARGDWKKEGYKIRHANENSPIFSGPRISAYKDGEEIGWVRVSPKKNKLVSFDTYVHPKHQRKGLATAMYIYAEKMHGKKFDQAALQTLAGKKLWSQPKRPFGKKNLSKAKEDVSIPEKLRAEYRKQRRQFSHDPLEAQITAQPGVSDRGIEARRGDTRNPGVISHGYARVSSPEKHKELARKYFKEIGEKMRNTPKPNLPKSEMAKGAIRRIYGKFDPRKELPEEQAKVMANWIGGNAETDGRDKLPQLSEGGKARSLNKLMSRAQWRKSPSSGQREYLLHRQMSEEELGKYHNNGKMNYDSKTSWTPSIEKLTQTGGGIYGEPHADYNHIVSAWVPESAISSYIPQYGRHASADLSPSKKQRLGPTEYADEQEVILHPHESQIHQIHVGDIVQPPPKEGVGYMPKHFSWRKLNE